MDNRDVLQRSLDYIEDNLRTEISARELADLAGFSLYHYYRLFQLATGFPVKRYILRRRLLHGIYAIRQGSSGIDAALAYGFDTYAGFYKAFQREFGCAPSEFLRLSRAKRPYRINLFREEHREMNHKHLKEILKHWNLETEHICDMYYEGTGNKNESACYVGEAYVLKYAANPSRLKTHIALSRALEAQGLCAAVPLPAGDGREVIQAGELFFCLTKRLPGRQTDVLDLYSADTAGKARRMGQLIGRLHLALEAVDVVVKEENLLAAVRDWALPRTAELLGLDTAARKRYLHDFAGLYDKLPRQIIHRDPNPGNLIRNGAQWGFIDFELSERNVRIYDPCYAATAILSETAGDTLRWEPWLTVYRNLIQGYDSIVKLREEEWQAVPYILLANQLVCTAWFAEQEAYARQLEVNKRMTRWMWEHFEDLLW